MRTAIYMLVGVCLIVLVGSFVPQQDTSATTKVQQFLVDHGNLHDLMSRLGLPLTQVFVSIDFYLLLGSLYVALGACVLRRGRALIVRTIRGYSKTAQYWGEWGSWLFHTAFFLLLVAVLFGKSTGFQGEAAIIEGSTFTDTTSQFDQLKEGLLSNGQHAGFQVHLNTFHATYAANGEASDYVSNVTVVDGGQTVQTKDVRVNDFLSYQNVDFYQLDYGWAPHMVITNPAGKVVFDQYVRMFSGPDGSKSRQSGVAKVPDFGYTIPGTSTPIQFGANVAVIPDAQEQVALNPNGTLGNTAVTYAAGGQEARNPVLQLQPWVGDLGLNSGATQNVTALNTSQMSELTPGVFPPVVMGSSTKLFLPGPNNQPVAFTVSFPDMKQYSAFMIKKDNGVGMVYVSFFCLMLGLITKLYIKPLSEARAERRDTNVAPRTGTKDVDPNAGGAVTSDHVTTTSDEAARHKVGVG